MSWAGVGLTGRPGILVPWTVEGLDVPSSGWMFSIMMASWSLCAAFGAFATGRVKAGERAIYVTRRLAFFASLCCFIAGRRPTKRSGPTSLYVSGLLGGGPGGQTLIRQQRE